MRGRAEAGAGVPDAPAGSDRRSRPAPAAAGRLVHRWRALPEAWRLALVCALALRAGAALFSLAAGGLLPGLEPVGVAPVPGTGFGGWQATAPAEQGAGLVGASLERFDALWYLAIARDGYPDPPGATVPPAAAFFPGFPLAVGVLARLLGGAWLLAANLVALAATVAGLAGLYRLVEEGSGDAGIARRSVIAATVFPASFFLVAPYTEALFVAASAWALVWARRGRFVPAAGAAAAAGLTRNVGLLLVVPLAWEAARRWRAGNSGGLRQAGEMLLGVAGAPLGLAAYLAYGLVRWGDALAPVSVQGGWERVLQAPWITATDAVRFGLSTPGSYATGYHTLDLLVALPVVVAAGWLLVRTPAPLAAYAALHVLVWLAYPFPSRPLMSTPRFALAVVPLFWAFGAWTRRRGAATVWWAVSGALLGVHLLLFVGWYYVF